MNSAWARAWLSLPAPFRWIAQVEAVLAGPGSRGTIEPGTLYRAAIIGCTGVFAPAGGTGRTDHCATLVGFPAGKLLMCPFVASLPSPSQ